MPCQAYTVDTKPWTASIPMRKTEDELFEYACCEGNYSLANILAGAPADQKKAAAVAQEGSRQASGITFSLHVLWREREEPSRVVDENFLNRFLRYARVPKFRNEDREHRRITGATVRFKFLLFGKIGR